MKMRSIVIFLAALPACSANSRQPESPPSKAAAAEYQVINMGATGAGSGQFLIVDMADETRSDCPDEPPAPGSSDRHIARRC